MPLIASIDGPTRLIYLSADTMNTAWHPVELYREVRALRGSDESLRKYNNFMKGDGNIDKGGGKATERYFTLLEGTRIVPYDASHVIDVTGTLISDDGFEGAFCFDKSSLSVGVSVDIQYAPKQVEVINLNFDDLVYSSFQGAVWIDVINGADNIGTDNLPNGNTERPVNSVQLATEIAATRGFNKLQIIGNLTLDTGDNVEDLELVGVSHVNSVLNVKPGAECLRTRFTSFDITGTLDGDSEINKCVVNDLHYFNGRIHDCMLNGTIILAGDANAVIDDCAMLNILNPPVINCNSSDQNLAMTNWSGQLVVINSGINNNLDIGCDAADLVIDSSCTDGIIAVSGTGSVIDNSTGDTYVVNKIIDGSEMQNLKVLIEQLRPHHTGGGKMIFWDPYGGSDVHHGDSPERGFKTWAKCHDTATNAGHDTIVIVPGDPAGVTTITEQISVTKDYLFVRGPGRDVIVTQSVLEDTLLTTARGTEFSGFRVQNTHATGHGLRSTGTFTLAENLWFEDCPNGIYMTGHHPLVHSCKIHGTGGIGIEMIGDISHGEIYDCTIGDAGSDAIRIDTTATTGGVKMRDAVVLGAAGYGVNLSNTTRKFISMSGNVVKYNALGDFNDLGTDNVLNVEGTSTDGTTPQEVWEYANRTLTEGGGSGGGVGLTPEESAAILSTKYQNKSVYIDAELAENGDGSATNPFNNVADTADFAEANGINTVYIYSDVVIDRNVKNFTCIGVGTPAVDCAGFGLKNTEFFGCELRGTYTGKIKAERCVLGSNFELNGGFKDCGVAGDLVCIDGGVVNLVDCFAVVTNLVRKTISMNGTGSSSLGISRFSGGLIISNMNNVNDVLEAKFTQGVLELDVSCTAGNACVAGLSKFINNSDGVTITHAALLDPTTVETTSADLVSLQADVDALRNFNEGSWKIIANQMIYYNTDGSEFMRFDLLDSAGQPISRGAMQRIKV